MESKNLKEPVLVGRERELEQLQRYLALAIEGKGKTVFISAEAGFGKTRLMQEFLKTTCKEENIALITGWCLSNAEVPYFPFIEAFSGFYSMSSNENVQEESELNPLLKGITNHNSSRQLERLSPQAIKDQAFLSIGKIIRRIATQKPVVLILEDIQWADSASLALIHYIARAFKNSERLLLLATFRSEALTSDSEGYPHQLAQTLAMMKREDLFNVIKLTGIEKILVSKMVESILGGSIKQNFAEKLADRSEGNPLFIVESIRMLFEQGKLVQKNNEWHFRVDDIDPPAKIKDIITQRIACLSNAHRRVLDAASVIGEEFKTGLLSTLVDQDNLEVLEILNQIVQSTSIIVLDEDKFRFDHALSREIVYESIAKPLRQAYHNRLAQKLESLDNSKSSLSELAYHYAQAQNKEKAIKYALAAGQNETAKWSIIEAINHFIFVLQSIGQDPTHVRIKEEALEGLGDAFYAAGLFNKANKAFEELGETAEANIVRLRAFRKAAESAFQLANPNHMLDIVKKAEPYAAADRLENARIIGCKSRALMLQRKPYIKELEIALPIFEEEYSLWDIAWTLMGIGNFYTGQGKDHQGLSQVLRSIAIFEELGDSYCIMESHMVAGYSFMRCLLYSEALNVYANMNAIDDKTKMGDFLHTCTAYSWSSSLLYLYMGDLQKGLAYSLKALELSEKTDSLVTKGIVYANLSGAYMAVGDVNNAKRYLERLQQLPQAVFDFSPVYGEFIKALVLSADDQGQAFRQLYKKLVASHVPGWSEAVEKTYAVLLEKQGFYKEAQAQNKKIQGIRFAAEKKFEQANIQASLIALRQVFVHEGFEMRFDLVNVGRQSCTTVKIDNAIPSEFELLECPFWCSQQKNSLIINPKPTGPFKVETVKLKVKALKPGIYHIAPKVFFIDNLGNIKNSDLNFVDITAKNISYRRKAAVKLSEYYGVTFASEAAEKAFKYLIAAYQEDQMKRGFSEQQKGWRTLTEISKNANITEYSMYGRHGRGGEATRELKRLDAIESRLFLGERGRAGSVFKMRIRTAKAKMLIDE